MVTQATKDRALGVFLKSMKRLFPFATAMTKEMKDSITAQRSNLGEAIISAISEMVGSGGSVGKFTDLTDAPSSYTGAGGKALFVSESEDGVVFSEGVPGPQGPQGAQGEQGPQGPAGASDETVISSVADIITYFGTQGAKFSVLAGTYDMGDSDVVVCNYVEARVKPKDAATQDARVRLTFNSGHGFKTWTAASASRNYSQDNHQIYWDNANARWNRKSGSAYADYPALDGTWYMAGRNRAYQCKNTSDATHIKVENAPVGYARFDQDTSAEYVWASLCIPTWKVRLTGEWEIAGASGHAGPVLELNGLYESDFSAARITVVPPATVTGSIPYGLIINCYKLRGRLNIKEVVNTGSGGIWWIYYLYNNACHIVEEWQNVALTYAGTVNGDHVVYHNQYIGGGIIELDGAGAKVTINAGTCISRGVDVCETQYTTIMGTAIDTEKSGGSGDVYSYATRNVTGLATGALTHAA